MTLDWPNIIAGAILGLIFTPVPRLIGEILSSLTAVKPKFSITGTWYSAEYDIKSPDPAKRNTILKVVLKKSLTGRITVKPLESLTLATDSRPTSWLVQAKMYGTVLVGTWVSTVPNTSRHGTVLLAFYDDGRGIGYYLGYADAPVSGYWLLSRDEKDLRALAQEVLRKFSPNDLKSIVDACDPRMRREQAVAATTPPSPPLSTQESPRRRAKSRA